MASSEDTSQKGYRESSSKTGGAVGEVAGVGPAPGQAPGAHTRREGRASARPHTPSLPSGGRNKATFEHTRLNVISITSALKSLLEEALQEEIRG